MDNYTGPFWSDGKWQASVANGTRKPKNRFDSFSRDHDTAYATCLDLDCLDRADDIYYERTRDFRHIVPRTVGLLPKYGNRPFRTLYGLLWGRKFGMGNSLSDRVDRDRREYLRKENQRYNANYEKQKQKDKLEPTPTPQPMQPNTGFSKPDEEQAYAGVYDGMKFDQPLGLDPPVPGIDDTCTYQPGGAIDANLGLGGNGAGMLKLNQLFKPFSSGRGRRHKGSKRRKATRNRVFAGF